MNKINKTLYIPLYGKSYVSKKGIILCDPTAEIIWDSAGFLLKRKSKSKWLAFYMAMRARVFDNWLVEQMKEKEDAIVIHIGCGLDSRINRVGSRGHRWYDVDFPEVIEERLKYYTEDSHYKMIGADVSHEGWLDAIPRAKNAIVVMEGVSMYLTFEQLSNLVSALCSHFDGISLFVDCYTTFAAKMSKVKNPVNDVGVTTVYGIDDPKGIEASGISFVKEWEMTPSYLVDELSGMEKGVFSRLYAGNASKKLYRLYEYKK